jgi:TRAP-type C4-dicarboxylate transport system permease small subunit
MWVERLIRAGSNLLAFIAGVCLVLMMLQVVADVVMKYLLDSPIEGSLEIVSFYYMVAVVFLPLAMVELRREHITVDLVVQLLPRRAQGWVYAAGCLVSAGFFAILAWQTYLDALRATRINEVMMGSIYVTIWPSRWALPVGFAMIMAATLLHAWRALRDPVGFDPSPADRDDPPPA